MFFDDQCYRKGASTIHMYVIVTELKSPGVVFYTEYIINVQYEDFDELV